MPIIIREAFAAVHGVDLLAVALSTFLAAAGIYISIYPLVTTKTKRIAVVLFSFVGIFSMFFVLWQFGETRVDGQRALDQATGGNAYCFFIPMQPTMDFPKAKWKLFAETNGRTFVPDVVADLRERATLADSEDEVTRKSNSPVRMNVGVVPKSGIMTNYEILPGAYQIDIYTRSERYIETIAIYPNLEPNALHKWHGEIEITHFPDGRLVRPRISY